jgi:hypothetical protein
MLMVQKKKSPWPWPLLFLLRRYPSRLGKNGKKDLLGMVSGELEDNLLAGQTTVDGNEGVELVLQRGRVLGIEEASGSKEIE